MPWYLKAQRPSDAQQAEAACSHRNKMACTERTWMAVFMPCPWLLCFHSLWCLLLFPSSESLGLRVCRLNSHSHSRNEHRAGFALTQTWFQIPFLPLTTCLTFLCKFFCFHSVSLGFYKMGIMPPYLQWRQALAIIWGLLI